MFAIDPTSDSSSSLPFEPDYRMLWMICLDIIHSLRRAVYSELRRNSPEPHFTPLPCHYLVCYSSKFRPPIQHITIIVFLCLFPPSHSVQTFCWSIPITQPSNLRKVSLTQLCSLCMRYVTAFRHNCPFLF